MGEGRKEGEGGRERERGEINNIQQTMEDKRYRDILIERITRKCEMEEK